jgi:hypothetical protein
MSLLSGRIQAGKVSLRYDVCASMHAHTGYACTYGPGRVHLRTNPLVHLRTSEQGASQEAVLAARGVAL